MVKIWRTNQSPKISSERSCVCLVGNVPFVMKMESKLNIKWVHILLLLCCFLIDSGPCTHGSSWAMAKKQKCVERTVNSTKSFEIHGACYWCVVNRYMSWRLTQILLIKYNCRGWQGRLDWVESVRYWCGEQATWRFSVTKPYVIEAGSLSCGIIALWLT